MNVPENMKVYEQVRSVPKEAQKQFNNGKFSGTDINPMWRIKKLTEIFGPAGIGWWTEDVRYWLESGSDGSVAAFCSLSLRFVLDGKTSQPVHGIGGNVFVRKNSTSDEAYKMAYTDALSIAAKALGVGADIWFQNDRSKYEEKPEKQEKQEKLEKQEKPEQQEDWTDVYTAMGDASNVRELAGVFVPAFNKATGDDKKNLEKEFRRLKSILEKKNV